MAVISRPSESFEPGVTVRPASTRTASWLLFLGAVALYSLSNLLENIHLSNPMLWAILSTLAAATWTMMGIALIKGSDSPKVPPLPSASGRT